MKTSTETAPGSGYFTKDLLLLYWLPTLCFLLHTLEELPQFASWVSGHFKPYTTGHFVLTHIPLIWLAVTTSYFATVTPHRVDWRVLAVAWQWQFGLNALFHLTTAAIFAEYSPGMLTAGAVNLPATGYLLYRVVQHGQLTRRQLGLALLIGSVVAVAAIASLL